MRIGIDVSRLREEKRGVGHYLFNLLENISRLDKEDEFYLYSPRPIKFYPAQGGNWHYRFGHLPLPGSFWFQTEGKRFIQKDKIDVFFGSCDILPLGLSKEVKKVLVVHDLIFVLYPETMANYNRFVHKLFFAKSIRASDAIIAVSQATKMDIVRHFQVESKKIFVIHEGVKEIFFSPEKEKILNLRHRYGLLKPYILNVGTLEPKKNHIILLKAFKKLKVDWDLVIIGKKGWKSESFFSTLKELKLSERVKILGYLPAEDLPLFYAGAEIFVFPSLYEGFGLPVLEAMACGTPVICSNVSSLPEIGGDAVLYFNPHSVEELVSQIERLIGDSELREKLKERGIERAKKFSWQKTAEETIKVLKGALK
ncbi:MAG: glycosyltransferase family 1 protein [candidate division WOR-3 bacterium]